MIGDDQPDAPQAAPAPQPTQQPARAFGHSIFDAMISSGALMVVTMLTGILLSRLLGPDGRGQYGSAVFWANCGVSFLTFSMFDAALVKMRSRKAASSRYLPSLLLLSVGFALLAAAIAVVLVLTGVIKVVGIATPVLLAFLVGNFLVSMGNRAFAAVEMGNLRFKMLNIERVVSPFLLMLCACVLFAVDSNSVPLLLLLFVLTKLPTYVPRFLRYRHNIVGPVDRPFLKESAKLGWRMNLSQGALALSNEADRLVLVPLWSATMLGYYFVAMSACGAALSLAGQAIQLTLLPTLSGLTREDKRRKLEQLVRVSNLVGAGVVVAVWVTAPGLIPLVFGADFAPAVPYARGLVFASVIKLTVSILTIAHFSEEKMLPGLLTAAAFVVVFFAGFLVTGFTGPTEFFVVLSAGNLASLAVALWLLKKEGLVSLRAALVPRWSDMTLLASAALRYVQAARRKVA